MPDQFGKHLRRFERAMQICAAIAADAHTFEFSACGGGEGLRLVRTRRFAHVDLVCEEANAGRGECLDCADRLVAPEPGRDGQQSEAARAAGVRFDALRILDTFAHYLISTADADDTRAGAALLYDPI